MIYGQEFPVGSRVRVHAPNRREGTDAEFHGRAGSVVAHGMWFAIKIDVLPRHWRNPVYLCPHNLRVDGELDPSAVER